MKPKKTELYFQTHLTNFCLSVEGSQLRMKERRAILLMLLRVLKKAVPTVKTVRIRHTDGHFMNMFHEYARGVSLLQSLGVDNEQRRMGFEIRMKRLKLGWTQHQFASALGISRVHLSRLEHGRYRMRLETRDRIDRLLAGVTKGYN